MVITSEIEKIRDIIVNTIPLEKLYLFGSYAYGTPNEDSDYDFYAVIPDGSGGKLQLYEDIITAGKGLYEGRAVDY